MGLYPMHILFEFALRLLFILMKAYQHPQRIHANGACSLVWFGGEYQLMERKVEEVVHQVLQEMQGDASLGGIIAKGVKVGEFYPCFRSFRRGAENTAMNNGVSQSTIELVHRWTKFERSRGKQPKSFSIFKHYASGEQTRPLQLSFSANL